MYIVNRYCNSMFIAILSYLTKYRKTCVFTPKGKLVRSHHEHMLHARHIRRNLQVKMEKKKHAIMFKARLTSGHLGIATLRFRYLPNKLNN